MTPLSARAARLAGLIAARRGGQRIALDELNALFAKADPGLQGSVDRRRYLAEDLAELAAAGLVVPAKSTDGSRQPPLPKFVTRPAPQKPPAPALPPILHHQLNWAAALPRLTAAQAAMIDAVNRWLFDPRNAQAPPAPLRERALEITGDEKAFDPGSLMGPDRITPELVRAYRARVPLHCERVGVGPVLLVVENSDTFDSLHRVLRADPGRVGWIGWGAGAAFEASVLSVRDLPVDEIRYFGDLDAAGLRIPANASRLAEAEGLPPVRPATGLYRELLAVGRPAEAAGQGRAELDWLDEPLREPVGRLLAGGHRMAQEAVSLAHLTRPGCRVADLVG